VPTPPTDCVECGAEIGWIEVAGDLLRYRPQRGTGGRGDWVPFAATATVATSIGAFLAGTLVSLWVPLVYFSGMSGVGVVAAHVHRKRKAITGAPMPAYTAPPDAGTWTGIAHALSGKTLAAGRERVLVEHLTLRDKHGGLLLRRIHAVPFVLEQEAGARIVVAGEVRVIGGAAASVAVTGDDPEVARMGVPDGMIKKACLEAQVVREGDAITVAGIATDELVPDLAFHRDGGQVAVVRGRRGALALIESRVVSPAS
jgi:hypothetical protein